jgi:hypothetical protein
MSLLQHLGVTGAEITENVDEFGKMFWKQGCYGVTCRYGKVVTDRSRFQGIRTRKYWNSFS